MNLSRGCSSWWVGVVALACAQGQPQYAAAPPRAAAHDPIETGAVVAASVEPAPALGIARDAGEGDAGTDEVARVEERSAASTPRFGFQANVSLRRAIDAKSVAKRFGNMTPTACAKQLPTWKGVFKRVGSQKGIATPVRVVGVVEGVKFRVPGERSKFGILDCRLALTLVEFAKFLKARDVVEVVVDNFYRVNARLPGKRSKRSQHAYGLAIDLRSFRLADGSVWDVEQDWGASTDTEPCGPDATLVSPTEHTVGLRTLTCELFEAQLFSHHLTPSHDLAHRNHLHLDIQRDAKTVGIR